MRLHDKGPQHRADRHEHLVGGEFPPPLISRGNIIFTGRHGPRRLRGSNCR